MTATELPRPHGYGHGPARFAPPVAEARHGGDVHAVHETPYGLRMLIGDVRGKGRQATGGAEALLAAFRTAAARAATLHALADVLEDAVVRHSAGRPDAVADEDFAAVTVAEFSPDGHTLRLLNHGLPAPLLLRPGMPPRALAPEAAGLPLGLRELAGARTEALTVPFPGDGTLLLLTDGTTEARDAHGAFYDPLARLSEHASTQPDELVRLLRREVRAHTAGRLARNSVRTADDMAVLAVRPPRSSPAPSGPGVPVPGRPAPGRSPAPRL